MIQVDRDVEAIGAHRPRRPRRRRRRAARPPRRCSTRSGTPAAALRGVRADALAAEIAAGRWRDEPYEESRDWLDPRTLSDRARRPAAAPSAPSSWTPARSWATRRCTCGCPDARGLRVPAGVPVRRARARQRDRRGDRRARPADRLRGRRRRPADGAARPGDARPAEAATCSSWSTTTPPTAPRSTTSGRWASRSSSRSSRPTDFAALAEAAGCRGVTARCVDDLSAVREWLRAPRPPARPGRQSRP